MQKNDVKHCQDAIATGGDTETLANQKPTNRNKL